jgi:hypothetical protein
MKTVYHVTKEKLPEIKKAAAKARAKIIIIESFWGKNMQVYHRIQVER